MNKFVSIKQWLLEKKNNWRDEPRYGCVMMEPSKFKDWEENHLNGINEKDVFRKPYDDSFGLEDEPHITVLYGIHEDKIDPSVVVDMMEQKMEPVTVTIDEIDIFENDDFDVVKYNVPVTEQLKEYRDMFMNAFENTQTFDGFHPHMTLAYVKKGEGKKYKKKLREPFQITFTKGVYSYHKDDPKTEEEANEHIRRVVNLEKEKEKLKDEVVKSKPIT